MIMIITVLRSNIRTANTWLLVLMLIYNKTLYDNNINNSGKMGAFYFSDATYLNQIQKNVMYVHWKMLCHEYSFCDWNKICVAHG